MPADGTLGKMPVNGSTASKSSGSRLRSLRLAGQCNEWLAAGLAMIGGFVDAYGMITYHTYLSFMSGHSTQTGYETGQGNFGAAVPSALAIGFFVGGSFAGALLVHSAVRRIRRLVFGMVASSLVLIIGFTRLGIVSNGVGIAVISFAMGAMNTALSRVGAESVSLTFVLIGIPMHLALAVRHAPLRDSQGSWDTHLDRARHLGGHLGRVPRLLPTFVLSTACGIRPLFERTASTTSVRDVS